MEPMWLDTTEGAPQRGVGACMHCKRDVAVASGPWTVCGREMGAYASHNKRYYACVNVRVRFCGVVVRAVCATSPWPVASVA